MDFEEKDEVQNDLRPEYDEETRRQMIKSGVRGKYTEKYRAGTNWVKAAPEIAAASPTEKAVNDALRGLMMEKIATSESH